MEDPALAKGIVKREIIRIVSPGTVTDSSVLDPGSNNYLMCISAGRTGQKVQETGCAVLDLSTGAFMVSEYDGNDRTGWLQDEYARFSRQVLLHSARNTKTKASEARLEQVSSAFVEPPSRRLREERPNSCGRSSSACTLSGLSVSARPSGGGTGGRGAAQLYPGAKKTDISHITRIGYLEKTRSWRWMRLLDQSRAYEDDPGADARREPAVGAGSDKATGREPASEKLARSAADFEGDHRSSGQDPRAVFGSTGADGAQGRDF